MFISVNVTLVEGDTAITAKDAVDQVITVFGADPAKDTVNVTISASSTPPAMAPPVAPPA